MLKSISICFVFFTISAAAFASPIACNGSPALLSKRYNEVAYATTHNGQSYKNSLVHNQDKTITEQLQAGIRAIKIPLWYGCDMHGRAIVSACHGMSKSLLYCRNEQQIIDRVPCIWREHAKKFLQDMAPAFSALRNALYVAYGEHDSEHGLIPFPHGMFDPAQQPFKDICKEVCTFLDTHPYEVVTFILEDFTDNIPLIAAAIQESGLLHYVHAQNINNPWPTLKEMIDSGKRMIIFLRSNDVVHYVNYPWLAPLWDYAWDTRYDFTRIADFKRDQIPHRGKDAYEQRNRYPKNKLFIVYHFITPFAGGSKKWARRANRVSILKHRLNKLKMQTGHIPNFVQVDFFEYPHNDIFKVINLLNNII